MQLTTITYDKEKNWKIRRKEKPMNKRKKMKENFRDMSCLCLSQKMFSVNFQILTAP